MNEKIKKILEAGVAAPSGDNCQPWEFEVVDHRVRVFNAPTRDTSLYNFEQRASLVAHGALLENLSIAALHYDFKPSIKTFPEPERPDFIAEIDLEPAESIEQPLFDFIFQRGTNRKIYQKIQIGEDRKRALFESLREVDGVQLFLVEDEEKIQKLAEALSLNDRLVFENQNLHGFLFDHLRWDDKEASSTRDGLDVKTLELSPLDSFGFRFMKNWAVVDLLAKVGLGQMIQKQARKLCLSASGFAAIGVRGDSRDDFLRGGRAVQRFWLEATRQSIACHSVSGVAYLLQRKKAGAAACSELSPTHQQKLQQVEEVLQQTFAYGDQNLVMIFRMGGADEPSARSLRIPPRNMIRNP